MKEPVDHITRPRLPWRLDGPLLTECGYDASKVKVITRDEYQQRLKDYGQQRAAMLTCMTCSQTAARWASWQEDPRKAMVREIEWETAWHGSKRDERLRDELLAFEALVAAHQEEFHRLVAEIIARREWNARKPAPAPKPSRQKW